MAARTIALAAGLCLAPLIGRFGGAGSLAFTMYSRTIDYRVAIIASDARGKLHAVAPTSLVPALGPSVKPFLAGADHFRRNYEVAPLRDHLPDLARIACDREGATAAERIEVVLTERPSHGVERSTRAEVRCAQ